MTTEKSSASVDDKSVVWKTGIILLLFPVFLFLPYDSIFSNVILPFAVGTALIYMSFKRIRTFDLTTKWKTTNGTVLYKKVAIDNPHARELVRSYFPYIKYEYIVHGESYVSDSVAYYRELKSSVEEIEKLMDKMTSSGLKVFYNPKNPEESVLIARLPLHRKLFWLFIFLLGSIAILVGLLPFVR